MFESRIRIDPEIRHGKPVIKGIILGSLAGGMGVEELQRNTGLKRKMYSQR